MYEDYDKNVDPKNSAHTSRPSDLSDYEPSIIDVKQLCADETPSDLSEYEANIIDVKRLNSDETPSNLSNYGPNPFIVDIHKSTLHNHTFRMVLWNGNHLQLTLMSLPVGEDIGLEMHPNVDQFLRIEEGQGLVQMGDKKDHLYLRQLVYDDSAIFVPAGTWHNLINTGNKPLKLYSIYAPPNHPYDTVNKMRKNTASVEQFY